MDFFKVNEGGLDRAARVGVGLGLLATGALGFCPLYKVFGLSTCPARP
jgi:hypothetical protein